jgi:uracil-DNA glycosylase family 4
MSEAPYPTIVTERQSVPNCFPILDSHPYRIAVIGDSPDEHAETYNVPFTGPSGNYFTAKLHDAGIDRKRIFLGHVSQVRQHNPYFSFDNDLVQSGIRQLKDDLVSFSPHICILLGEVPLRMARLNTSTKSYRGSLFRCELQSSPLYGRKCVASYLPKDVLKDYALNPLFDFDLKRARAEGQFSDLVLPSRELLINLTPSHMCLLMDTWPAGQRCSIDIEGGLPNWAVNDGVRADSKRRRHIGWRCVALSATPSKAFAIPWWKFSIDDHARLLQSFARLMWRDDVPKVLQNSLYDNFVLAYGYACPIRNVTEDTMLKGWEVFSELPKGLSTMASIWTREPHWKDDDMYDSNGDNLATGCCKDVAVTMEICLAQDGALDHAGLLHYRKNIEMLQPALYMELRGIKLNQSNVKKQIEETIAALHPLGSSLVATAGNELRGKKGSLSSDRLIDCLYQTSGRVAPSGKAKVQRSWLTPPYPPQYKTEFVNGFRTKKLTSDVEAILTLGKKYSGDAFLAGILEHRHLEGILETLHVQADADGRVRCAYNVVGTETGRFSCKTSPTGAGTNMTTITKKLRHNYVAD